MPSVQAYIRKQESNFGALQDKNKVKLATLAGTDHSIYIYIYHSLCFSRFDKASQATCCSNDSRKLQHVTSPDSSIDEVFQDIVVMQLKSSTGRPEGGARKSYEHHVKLICGSDRKTSLALFFPL